jgi:hypothetical protein
MALTTELRRLRDENERLRVFVEGFIEEAPSERAAYDDHWRNKWCDLADEAHAILTSLPPGYRRNDEPHSAD